MNFKTLMLIKAVVCLVFAFLLLFFPKMLLSLMGADLGPGGVYAARLYGAALTGNLMLTWYAREAGPSKARRALILDLMVYDAVGLIVTIVAVLSDGAQTLHLGELTFPIIQQTVTDILTASDAQLVDAMKTFAATMKVIVEPTGALGFAGFRTVQDRFAGKRVGIIISGGNIDLARFASLVG